MVLNSMGSFAPTLSALAFVDTLSVTDITTGDIPVAVTHDTFKFLNNSILSGNVTTGVNVGPAFSPVVVGKRNRAYEITVTAKTALGVYKSITFAVSHFDLVTPVYDIISDHGYVPGGGTAVTVGLTMTAGTDNVAVDFSDAPNCTYSISMNFLDQISI